MQPLCIGKDRYYWPRMMKDIKSDAKESCTTSACVFGSEWA